ncbi:hypothetical protein [Streptomyces sp. NPDC059909]|uniref:hypothetical protein n=1 Tax=Streptomyces sp. NPDC059909 TaxID=3346998 RepID=UPI003647AD7A
MKDKKRKDAIRAEQKASGRRYTAVARELAIAGTERTFLLQDLLSECATFPPATIDWGYPEELAPAAFESRVLGGAVPFSTVKQLAGALAEEGRRSSPEGGVDAPPGDGSRGMWAAALRPRTVAGQLDERALPYARLQ